MLFKVEICLPMEVRKKGEWWISSCPVLDVCSQGRTKKEARINLEDALVFFVESCVERGTLFQVLREAGFERVQKPAKEVPCQADDNMMVKVPLPFMIPRDRIRADQHVH